MAIDLNAEMVAARAELSRFGSVSPRVVVDSLAGERIAFLQTVPPTTQARLALMLVIGFDLTRLLGERPTDAAFIAEAWMAAPRPGEQVGDIPPSMHPDRQEAVIAIAKSVDGELRAIIQPFRRNRRGQVVFDPTMADDSGEVQGRQLDALWLGVSLAATPDDPDVQAMVQLARFASGGDVRIIEVDDFDLN